MGATDGSGGLSRWRELDAFRFAAVLLMVQGHTFTALLHAGVRAEPWYGAHRFVHGFTAPMFLFGAGLAFAVATLPRVERFASLGPETRARLTRYVAMVLLGYVLHLPTTPLAALARADREAQAVAFQVDALQLIGVSMMLLSALVVVLRSASRIAAAAALLTAGPVAVGPAAWRSPEVEALPPWLSGYFTSSLGSPFPFVPWGAYVFAGVLGVAVARGGGAVAQVRPRSWLLTGAGLAAVAGALHAAAWLDALLGPHDAWVNDPANFLVRVGVMMVCLGLLGSARPVFEALPARALRVLERTSQESLVVYVVHLVLLYGLPGIPGVVARAPGGLGLLPASVVVVPVLAVSVAAALLWHLMRRRFPLAFRALRVALALGIALAVVLRW